GKHFACMQSGPQKLVIGTVAGAQSPVYERSIFPRAALEQTRTWQHCPSAICGSLGAGCWGNKCQRENENDCGSNSSDLSSDTRLPFFPPGVGTVLVTNYPNLTLRERGTETRITRSLVGTETRSLRDETKAGRDRVDLASNLFVLGGIQIEIRVDVLH